MKNFNGINSRILALKRRTDHVELLNEQLSLAQKHLGKADRRIEKYLKEMDLPIANAALAIRGLGAITIASLVVYLGPHKAIYETAIGCVTTQREYLEARKILKAETPREAYDLLIGSGVLLIKFKRK